MIPAVMAITLKFDGIEYFVSTPAEAAELTRELKKGAAIVAPAAHEKPSKQANSRQNGSEIEIDPDVAARALKFLKAIRDGSDEGVQSDVMMTVFGVRHAKAIGSRSGAVNRLIKDMGFRLNSVYKNPRTPNGRVWRSGRSMAHAISTIEQRLAAH